MPLPKEELYTTDFIYNLPDGERAELIDGQIYYMAPPTFTHQRFLNKLSQQITNYIDAKKGSCEVVPAPFAVFLNKDDRNYVEPDISVICDKSKLNEKGCFGSPDWIIEVVSTSSKRLDYHIKLFKYRTAGVKEYWIIDPLKKLVTVYNFENEVTEFYTFNDTVKAGIYEDLYIDFSDITEQYTIMKFLKQFSIILTFAFIGELLNYLLPLPIPASIYGIVLLFVCLCLNILPLEAVKDTGKFLIEIMPVMFIPAATGLLNSWDIIKPSFVNYGIITLFSTIIVMGVTGRVTQAILNHISKKEEN